MKLGGKEVGKLKEGNKYIQNKFYKISELKIKNKKIILKNHHENMYIILLKHIYMSMYIHKRF